MNMHFGNDPIVDGALRRARLAAARFALRKGGALLRAGAPLVVQAGQKLEALSEHPALADPLAPPKPR